MLTSTFSVFAGALLLAAPSAANFKPGHGLKQPLRPRQDSTISPYPDYINGTTNNANPVTLSVATQGGGRNATAPLLYGWMFEDISHSGEGGLYGELLVNRAFQGSASISGMDPLLNGTAIIGTEGGQIIPTGPTLVGYGSLGGARLQLDLYHPLSAAIPVGMEVDIPANATGEVGFFNTGFWGFSLTPQTYTASMYVLVNGPRQHYGNLSGVTLSLRSNTTGQTLASTRIDLTNTSISDFSYTYLETTIVSNVTAPDTNNTFVVTFDGAEVAGASFFFSLLSLFPETFHNRTNGLRPDLAYAISDLKPAFLRFPGGNNIEGNSIANRWIWNNTIGPLKDRVGRVGDWGYYNTNGLGLMEFLLWSEDMNMERVLAVYSGLSLDFSGYGALGGTSYPEDHMDEVLQYALDELEFCMGNTSTYWGNKRAEFGHPEPFQINYVEIGNEDWFSGTYPYRFPIMYNGLKAAYPNITLISSAFNEAQKSFNYTIDLPPGSMWDTHHYEEPSFFLKQFDYFDNWQEETNNPNVTVLIGEYSVYQIDTPSGVVNYSNPSNLHIQYPRLLSAIAESVYLLGAERNPNTVKMTSYAPSFQNIRGYNWTPNLVVFDSDPVHTTKSVSWQMQSLFAHYRGTETLPVTDTEGGIDPLWWVAVMDEPSGEIYLKMTNSGNHTIPLTVNFDLPFNSVNGTILTNPDLNAFNYLYNSTAVVSVPVTFPAGTNTTGQTFTWGVPPYSINVLQFNTR
ncbi:hypothetical protein MMC25_004015 [Agyrium rufum]|nr:hypothetical protein [Agyrium rufum]